MGFPLKNRTPGIFSGLLLEDCLLIGGCKWTTSCVSQGFPVISPPPGPRQLVHAKAELPSRAGVGFFPQCLRGLNDPQGIHCWMVFARVEEADSEFVLRGALSGGNEHD